MKLSGIEIARLQAEGRIMIDPWNPEQLNPNSYNLRLGPTLLYYKKGPKDPMDGRRINPPWDEPSILDIQVKNPTEVLKIPHTGLTLYPGVLYLGSTVEYTETPEHIPCLEGRSSIGRLGISVHNTAGFGDIGFCGCWTLEISVVQPIRIYPFVQFCQICYEPIQGEYRKYQSAKNYAEQQGPKASGIWREFHEDKFLKGTHGTLRTS